MKLKLKEGCHYRDGRGQVQGPMSRLMWGKTDFGVDYVTPQYLRFGADGVIRGCYTSVHNLVEEVTITPVKPPEPACHIWFFRAAKRLSGEAPIMTKGRTAIATHALILTEYPDGQVVPSLETLR